MEKYILIGCSLAGSVVLLKIMSAPIRLVWKLFINIFAGFFLLVLLNWMGSFLGIRLGINMLSVILTALLGLPGIGALLVINAGL